MNRCLNYNINNVEYLKTRGTGLADIIMRWLKENNIDATVHDFVLGDYANIIVDYSFDETVEDSRAKQLVEQIFERFNIPYELDME